MTPIEKKSEEKFWGFFNKVSGDKYPGVPLLSMTGFPLFIFRAMPNR